MILRHLTLSITLITGIVLLAYAAGTPGNQLLAGAGGGFCVGMFVNFLMYFLTRTQR